MAKVKKEKRRKVKYYKYRFSLSENYRNAINYYCEMNDSTPNKVFKEALYEFLKDKMPENRADLMLKNQLDLFHAPEIQIDLFEGIK